MDSLSLTDRRVKVSVMLAAVSLFLSGCASLLTQNMSNDDPNDGDVVKAVAVDVVTAPAQVAIGIPLLASAGLKESKRKKTDTLIQSFEDDAYRKSYIRENRISNDHLYSLLVHPNRTVFDKGDIAFFWFERDELNDRKIRNTLMSHPNAPSEILSEYYYDLKHEIESANADFGRSLRSYQALIRHPNLPDNIIQEMKEIDDFRVNEYLCRNPKVNIEPVVNGQRY